MASLIVGLTIRITGIYLEVIQKLFGKNMGLNH
jgi:hypothetical protein